MMVHLQISTKSTYLCLLVVRLQAFKNLIKFKATRKKKKKKRKNTQATVC